MINTILQFFSSSYYLYIYDLINNGSYLTLLHSSLQLIKNDQQLVLLRNGHEAHATNLILKTPAFCKIPEQRILFLRYQFKAITIFNFNFDVKFNFSRIGVSATSFLGLILIITRPIIFISAVLLI